MTVTFLDHVNTITADTLRSRRVGVGGGLTVNLTTAPEFSAVEAARHAIKATLPAALAGDLAAAARVFSNHRCGWSCHNVCTAAERLHRARRAALAHTITPGDPVVVVTVNLATGGVQVGAFTVASCGGAVPVTGRGTRPLAVLPAMSGPELTWSGGSPVRTPQDVAGPLATAYGWHVVDAAAGSAALAAAGYATCVNPNHGHPDWFGATTWHTAAGGRVPAAGTASAYAVRVESL